MASLTTSDIVERQVQDVADSGDGQSSVQSRHSNEGSTTLLWARLPQRIALLHLDSLSCLPALDCLFAGLGDRIGLVVSSDRFGGRAGGFWHQARTLVSRCGLPFTLALG